MGNYKRVDKQLGTPMYYQEKAGSGAQLLFFDFIGNFWTRTLHDTKTNLDYKTPVTKKLKVMGVMIHCIDATGTCDLYESSVIDGGADSSTLLRGFNAPTAGEWWFPLKQLKVNKDKYLTVVNPSTKLWSFYLVGYEE